MKKSTATYLSNVLREAQTTSTFLTTQFTVMLLTSSITAIFAAAVLPVRDPLTVTSQKNGTFRKTAVRACNVIL